MYSSNFGQSIAKGKFTLVILFLLGFLSTLLTVLSLKLAFSRIKQPQPQGILVLGGSANREIFAARFASSNETIPIWLSSGANPIHSRRNFHEVGISLDRVYHDRSATDTVTNFTTLVDNFDRQQIQHLYVVTSDYHMTRATAIATIVLGSRGIAFTPLVVSDRWVSDPSWKTVRDTIRALIWLYTGYTGANLDR